MKRTVFFGLTLFIFAGFLNAQDDFLSLFNKAGKLYDEASYSKAAELYGQIAASGQKNAELFYNLANAYFKNGRIGKAILYYERAKRISPRDSSIKENLSFARKQVNEPQEPFFESVLSWISESCSMDGSFAALAVFYAAAVLCAIFFLVSKSRLLLYCSVFFLVFFLCAGGIFALQYKDQKLTRWAVITSSCDAYNGPGTENSAGFSLPEGRKAVILSRQGDWVAVGIKSEGLKGWIRSANAEEI